MDIYMLDIIGGRMLRMETPAGRGDEAKKRFMGVSRGLHR